MHVVPAAVCGVLEKLWPSTVRPHDYDVLLADAEAEYETFEPSPTIHTSGDSAAGAIPPALAALPPVEWLSVAVKEELAHHHYRLSAEGCDCGDVEHLRPMDPYDWREHVSPIITATVLKCIEGYHK